MRRGFTIIEVLVASLLLGMLTTILTMIFNQSSIAWRTGTATVTDLDDVRENIAEVRDEADNLYVWKSDMFKILSPWNRGGELRNRSYSCPGNTKLDSVDQPSLLRAKSPATEETKPDKFKDVTVGNGEGNRGFHTYTVNVKSAGPDGEHDTWDDIWSYPDDPSEW